MSLWSNHVNSQWFFIIGGRVWRALGQVWLQFYISSSDTGANHIIHLKQNIQTSGRGEEQFHHEGNIFHHCIVFLMRYFPILMFQIFILRTKQLAYFFVALFSLSLKLFALASLIIRLYETHIFTRSKFGNSTLHCRVILQFVLKTNHGTCIYINLYS